MLWKRVALQLACVVGIASSLIPPHGRPATLVKGASQQYLGTTEDERIITPKLFILNFYRGESAVWQRNPQLDLQAHNVTVPGFSPRFPQAHCTAEGDVCQLTTDEGEIHAASTMMALWLSGLFNLTSTYLLISGVGGINPHMGTTGSVTFARYAVQVDLQYLFSEAQLPEGSLSGFLPQGAHTPTEYPRMVYGTEVFELNDNLRKRAARLARRATLNNTAGAQAYRSRYHYAPANEPPGIVECDTATSNNWWSGSVLADAFAGYVKTLTNGTALTCTTQQEDNAVLEALLRGALARKLDFSRIILMRAASDFAWAPPGVTEFDHLVNGGWEGFPPAIANIFLAGIEIVKDIRENWEDVYAPGIMPGNYVGDLWHSLPGP